VTVEYNTVLHAVLPETAVVLAAVEVYLDGVWRQFVVDLTCRSLTPYLDNH